MSRKLTVLNVAAVFGDGEWPVTDFEFDASAVVDAAFLPDQADWIAERDQSLEGTGFLVPLNTLCTGAALRERLTNWRLPGESPGQLTGWAASMKTCRNIP